MGFRAAMFIVIFGGILGLFGWTEWKVSRNASATPEAITFEELEKGPPQNPYRTLGEHKPIYQLVIYSGKKDGKISYAYYPITSEKTLAAVTKDLVAKHKGKVDEITDDEFATALDPKVLVKTTSYTTLTDLKAAVDKETFPSKDVEGLVTNEISSLSTDEKRMLGEKFKHFDPDKVVIFESGRKPSSTGFAFGMMGLGGGLVLIGLLGWLMGRRKG